MSRLVIRRQADGGVEHTIDVTGKTEREVELAERGVLRQMDAERFTVGLEQDGDES